MIQSSGICGLLREHTRDDPGVSDQENRTNPITEQLRANQSRYLAQGNLFRVKRFPHRAKKILQSISANRVVVSVSIKLPPIGRRPIASLQQSASPLQALPFGCPSPTLRLRRTTGETESSQEAVQVSLRLHKTLCANLS